MHVERWKLHVAIPMSYCFCPASATGGGGLRREVQLATVGCAKFCGSPPDTLVTLQIAPIFTRILQRFAFLPLADSEAAEHLVPSVRPSVHVIDRCCRAVLKPAVGHRVSTWGRPLGVRLVP
jgi:hypothetical protein